MTGHRVVRFVAIVAAGFSLAASLTAQQQNRSVTAADYARAERMLAQNLNGLVIGGSVTPNWLPDERFWYRSTTLANSSIVVLVDPVKRTRQVCSDQIPECRGLGGAATPAVTGGPRGGRGGGTGTLSSDGKPVALSPDGRHGVFIRDWNLYLRDSATGQERQLTRDGV